MVFLGYYAAMAYLFMRISRCGDYFGYLLAHLHVPLIVLLIATVGALSSGRFINAMLSKMGLRFIALTFVFLLSSAFSLWPGGSVHQFKDKWPPNLIFFLVMASFLTTAKGLRSAVSSLGFGVGLVAVYSMMVGDTSGAGRMDGGGTTYSNPNDLALVMVIGTPALIYLAADRTRGILQRAVAGALLVPVTVLLLATGSRGGALGFAIMAAFMMWHQSWGARLRVGVALAVLVTVAVAAAPGIIVKRLTTFMESNRNVDAISDVEYGDRTDGSRADGSDYTGLAAASAQGRWHLTQQAAQLMVMHPVLGVGFAMFMVAENDLATSEGAINGSWKGTHNMYMQMGSENGFTGLILFLAIAFASWKTYRTNRTLAGSLTATERDLSNMAFALSASMVGFFVAGTFLTIAYDYFLPMYAALAVGFDNVTALEAQRRSARGGALEPVSVVEGARGQIDWTVAPAPIPVPAHLRQGL